VGPLTASDAEIQLFRELLSSKAGIDFGRMRETFLESRLRRRMREAGARSLYEYYRMVTAPGDARGELQSLVDEVSIHETSFFRNPAQFETLEGTVLADRVSTRLRDRRRRLYLWSAGCSTGQEPYSMAMSLFEHTVLPETWDVRLMATDISGHVLRQCRRAAYTAAQMEGVSAERRRRFFEKKGDTFTVRSWLRQRLEFQLGNLLDGPPLVDLDVVFCRNVMIYFDRATQRRLGVMLARVVAPGGYLFLGHTETLTGLTDAFRMVSRPQGIAYQRLP
jgi:chemotaxis protein methyltransferase CheR